MNESRILAAIERLLDNASQDGCTSDVAVVSSKDLLDLADAAWLPKPLHILLDDEEDVD